MGTPVVIDPSSFQMMISWRWKPYSSRRIASYRAGSRRVASDAVALPPAPRTGYKAQATSYELRVPGHQSPAPSYHAPVPLSTDGTERADGTDGKDGTDGTVFAVF